MGRTGLSDMLGGGGGRTRQKYRCKADGCQVTPMGVNLAKHYKVNTDWVLLKELKACVGDAALKKKMDQTDPHTRYIFEKGYSKKRLPHCSHHARVTMAGPLHLLSNLRDKMYTMRPREYVYKKNEDGSLATHWSRLADVDSGSAVKTYRQLQIEKAHLPVELWESDVSLVFRPL